MMTTVWEVAPALRMDSTVVVEPSEPTPFSVLALTKIMNSVLPADAAGRIAEGRRGGPLSQASQR